MKVCNKCNEEKEYLEFYRNTGTRDGYKSVCKICEKEGKKAVYPVSYYKDKALLRRYGITLSEYNEMLKQQKHKCKICGVNEKHCDKALCVDHNHETGAVRGLLCRHCNTGLGQFRDRQEFLLKAVDYLDEYKEH